jgi:hypothetical protein
LTWSKTTRVQSQSTAMEATTAGMPGVPGIERVQTSLTVPQNLGQAQPPAPACVPSRFSLRREHRQSVCLGPPTRTPCRAQRL